MRFQEVDYTSPQKLVPTCELHTHFPGILSAEKLIELGKLYSTTEKPFLLPAYHLDILGFDKNDFSIDENSSFPLSELLRPKYKAKYLENLSLSESVQDTFSTMDKVYDLRWPFFSDKKPNKKEEDYFYSLFDEIAKTYIAHGVRHVSMSFTSTDNKELISMFETIIPEIEKKHQNKIALRFLASFARNGPFSAQQDFVDEAKKLCEHSPVFEGVDILGHETTDIRDCEHIFKEMIPFFAKTDKRLCFRVHAGENEEAKHNVLHALEMMEKHGGKNKRKFPEFRIGHGIYGYHCNREKVSKLRKTLNCIFEICLTSNLSLGNIDKVDQAMIQEVVKGGPTTISTDGPAVYQTNLLGETNVFLQFVGNSEDLNEILALNQRLVRTKRSLFNEKTEKKEFVKVTENLDDKEYLKKYIQAEYDGSEEKRLNDDAEKRKLMQRMEELTENLSKFVCMNPSRIAQELSPKTRVLITGEKESEKIIALSETAEDILLQCFLIPTLLDPQKTCIVLPGFPMGVTGMVANTIKHLKEKGEISPHLPVVGILSKQSMEQLQSQPMPLTHAIVATTHRGDVAATDFDLCETAKKILSPNDALIGIGGSYQASMLIQTSHNNGVPVFLFDKFGRSKSKIELLGEKGYTDAYELAKRLVNERNHLIKGNIKEKDLKEIIEKAIETIQKGRWERK